MLKEIKVSPLGGRMKWLSIIHPRCFSIFSRLRIPPISRWQVTLVCPIAETQCRTLDPLFDIKTLCCCSILPAVTLLGRPDKTGPPKHSPEADRYGSPGGSGTSGGGVDVEPGVRDPDEPGGGVRATGGREGRAVAAGVGEHAVRLWGGGGLTVLKDPQHSPH